jgi:arylsulfatase A-like enzyme
LVAALAGAVLVWIPRVRASALLAAAGALALCWQGAQHVPRLAPAAKPAVLAPSVLLVTIDTLRADRVGAYGYAAARTPNLDALAAQGVLFRNAFAHSMFTGPSHATILSSRMPTSTGVLVNHQRLDDRFETLAQVFAGAGYVTAAFPSSYATAERATHLPGRFQFMDEDTHEHSTFPQAVRRCVLVRVLWPWLMGRSTWPFYRPALATTDRALRFLDANAGVPLFAWVHYYDPHLPYVPPAELRAPNAKLVSGDWYRLKPRERRALVRDPQRVAAMHALYDAEITYVDRELGRLIEAARAAAPPGGLLIAVTADHGEPMGEHGHYWKRDLHDVTLHVPLLVLPPEREPVALHSVDALVRLIDVAPTLLDWSGAPALAQAEGLSLRPLAQGETGPSPRPPAVAVALPESDSYGGLAASVRSDLWKLIRKQGDLWAADAFSPAATSLYDLTSDPGEATDVLASFPEIAAYLETLLPRLDESAGNPELTDDERESLRALGYLQ